MEQAAHILGNTAAACRRAHVHPAVVDEYLDGNLCDASERCYAATRRPRRGLDRAERMVLRFLRDRRDELATAALRAAAA